MPLFRFLQEKMILLEKEKEEIRCLAYTWEEDLLNAKRRYAFVSVSVSACVWA